MLMGLMLTFLVAVTYSKPGAWGIDAVLATILACWYIDDWRGAPQ